MAISIDEKTLNTARVSTRLRLNRDFFNLDDLLTEYRRSQKGDTDRVRNALIEAFSYQALLSVELERRLPNSYNLALVFSLEAAAKVGLEHLADCQQNSQTAKQLQAKEINLESTIPNPVSEALKAYFGILKDVIRYKKDLESSTAEFFRWLRDKASGLEQDPKYLELNLFLQKNPITIGNRTFDRVDDQSTLPHSLISGFVWDNVGGYEGQKNKLIRISRRIKNIDRASLYMENPIPRGILMYGPSGTGKTLMASTFSYQSGLPSLNVQAASLGSAYVNETAKRWQTEVFDKAKAYIGEALVPGCVIFVDEIDRVCPDRRHLKPGEDSKVLGVFFENMYGNLYVPGVLVIAATNRAYVLDSALLSRFEPILELGFPDIKEMEQIYSICFKKAEAHSHRFSGFESRFMESLDYRKLAESSEGLTGRNIYDVMHGLVGEQLDIYLETGNPVRPIQMKEVIQRIEAYKSENSLKIRKNQADYEQSREFLAQLV